MKQVKRRTWFCLVFTALLALGLGVFLIRYLAGGGDWAAFRANRHLYEDGRLASGAIYDRKGTPLYDAASGAYSEDQSIRKATLHAVGDQAGNIATGALHAFRPRLSGFGPILGTTGGGHKLYLTIDADLNAAAYDALSGQKGVVGVYNYKTGEVLCMVSLPAFDPASPPAIQEGDSRYEGVYVNRLLSALYTPGSVFKLVTTAAALEQLDGVQERAFTCDGSIELDGETITCPSAHGDMDLSAALARSCNGVYAQLAQELGAETLRQYAEKAGLLSSQSVSGISTAAGRFDTDGGAAELGWSGVGQHTDLVNPCAMMTFCGAIANRGAGVTPRLIAKETSAAGLPAGRFSAEKSSSAIKKAAFAALAEMMRNNVTEQYGQDQFGGLAVCAKSGTAEVGGGLAPHAWFTGFIDDEAHPLAFVVVAENGGSGALVAGNIAARVLLAAVEAGY